MIYLYLYHLHKVLLSLFPGRFGALCQINVHLNNEFLWNLYAMSFILIIWLCGFYSRGIDDLTWNFCTGSETWVSYRMHKSLKKYLTKSCGFIYVVNTANAGGVQRGRVSVVFLQICLWKWTWKKIFIHRIQYYTSTFKLLYTGYNIIRQLLNFYTQDTILYVNF
jgi:hypothetical protein